MATAGDLRRHASESTSFPVIEPKEYSADVRTSIGHRKRLREQGSDGFPDFAGWERSQCFDLTLTSEFISVTVSADGIFCTRDRSAS